ncbi:MAG TPA: hypothetical protein VGY76_06595 [Solirubrobacteraceae bacterium]|nr:hypothetical protein [Solirubrobacteraceae bacterium]
MEAFGAADELGVGENRFDDLLSSPVERLALRSGEDILDSLGLGPLLGGQSAGAVRRALRIGMITSIPLPRIAVISGALQ